MYFEKKMNVVTMTLTEVPYQLSYTIDCSFYCYYFSCVFQFNFSCPEINIVLSLFNNKIVINVRIKNIVIFQNIGIIITRDSRRRREMNLKRIKLVFPTQGGHTTRTIRVSSVLQKTVLLSRRTVSGRLNVPYLKHNISRIHEFFFFF